MSKINNIRRGKAALLFVLTIAALCMFSGPAQASSHREAPFITELPKVDGTDFYMFRSYEPGREGFVTLVANYQPFQEAFGGPNYYAMDPNALYEIHIDNNGDAKEEITFQFRFKQTLKDTKLSVGGQDVSIPLINSGPVGADNSNLNVVETYTVNIVRGNRRTGKSESVTNAANGDKTFTKPVDNIGQKSIADYTAYANNFIYNINIPGCNTQGKLFAGQRKDPFVVNLGEIFDLINTDPLGPVNGKKDNLADKNVTSLILEVPIACLKDKDPVIGGWTTASLRQGRIINPNPTFDKPAVEGGPWAQVSRLGMPLVNEVVIGLKDKDKWNSSKPENDAQFAPYVTNPTLPALIQLLFPSAPAPTLIPRADLVATFLTGLKTPAGNLNQPLTVTPSEMLRLNTDTPPVPRGSQKNLGVIAGDNAGFPNGRRPGDDVVDISLRVVMGKLISLGLFGTPQDAPAGNAPFTDGAFVDDSFFDGAFPYIKPPLPGSPNK